MTTRRGFTMIELMMGLVLTLLVGAVTYQLLANNQRVSRGQTAHVSLQDNVRAGGLIVANELREVGYDAISATASVKLNGYGAANRTDLVTMDAGGVSYFAMRGLAFVCGVVNGAPAKVIVKQAGYSVLRPPVATDSMFLYVENESTTASDDAWVHLGIGGPPANQMCPDGITPGYAFNVGFPVGLSDIVVFPNVTIGSPIRLAEVVRLELYVSGGKSWLGMRSLSAVGAQNEPIVGPLADNAGGKTGLTFEYLNKVNAVTAVQNNVRSVRV